MPIDMWVRTEMPERGTRVDESEVPWKVPRGVLNERDTPLLIAIDPIGDTMFNRFQVERQLPREVAFLRAQLAHTDSSQVLDELERLMTLTTERLHHYLWFVGD